MVRHPGRVFTENVQDAQEFTTLLKLVTTQRPTLSLLEALYAVSTDVYSSQPGRLCRYLIEFLEAGASTYDAFMGLPTYFPSSYARAVEEAERRRALPEAFAILENFLDEVTP